VTNQAGIAKGYFSEKDFISLHQQIKKFLIKKKIYISDVKYSPYHKDSRIPKYKKNSQLRKPGNLMIRQLFKEWPIIKNKSFMIGDKNSDKLAATKSKVYFEYPQNNIFQQIKRIEKYLNKLV
jgi:D-glycero-D-manno-heptose 1,7-bisphosphate phosphatase